jgi:predicted kinase
MGGRPGPRPPRAAGGVRVTTVEPVALEGMVVVAGLPGSGKTTLATSLAPMLGLPLISKDTIKEALFDTLGVGDLEWSQKLGRASHAVMYALAAQARSAVLESHFWPGISEADLHVIGSRLLQVYCRCPVEIALERYMKRAESSERHPAHLPPDQESLAIERWTSLDAVPLDLHGDLLEVDTSGPVDVAGLVRQIRPLLAS